MPYAIFSKRTKIINRIVDDLTSLLPSESMLEVDDEINYPRAFHTVIEGQDQNTSGFPLFYDGSNATTIQPTHTSYDGDDRPYTEKNYPIYIAPTVPGGARKTVWTDIPITSHPFVWTVSDLAALKYESILSQNYPWQVIIGEEFVNEDHIDTANSSGAVISEGKLNIAPDGVFQSEEFKFLVTSNGVIDPETDTGGVNARTFVFDTFYMDLDPDPFEAIEVSWEGRAWGAAWIGSWYEVTLNEEMPTTKVNGTDQTATKLTGIRFKIQNKGPEPFSIENYTVLLRVRNLPTV